MSNYERNDLLLVPKLSSVNSRLDTDLSVKLSDDLKLEYPIIASPMKGIASKELIVGIDILGGIGILHRFYSSNEELIDDLKFISNNAINWGNAIGLDEYGLLNLSLGFGSKIVCIDVANGYTENVRKFVSEVKEIILKRNSKTLLMAGNVSTPEGFNELVKCGADLVRVGIGTGQLCTTRLVTGIGVPQLTALDQCKKNREKGLIVSDGGIRYSGDAVKDLAAGADLLMLGSLLGQTFESSHNGIIYGMASRKLQEEYYHGVKSVEGIEKVQEQTMSLKDFMSEFTFGIRSAMTYLNSKNLEELRKNALFVEA